MLPAIIVHVILLREVNKTLEVFLLRRFNTGYADGMWAFPSGHVDPGESKLDAAAYEAFEEVDIRIDISQLIHYCGI